MAERSAPDSGYNFGAKRQYRRDVWATFRRAIKAVKPVSEAFVALMPSTEGAEIDCALASGFRETNIIAIDQNPAIVASLKRRYRGIKTIGVSAARAADRIERVAGCRIDAVNLDLCGAANEPMFNTLLSWSKHRPIVDMGLLAITMLRGRERTGTFVKEHVSRIGYDMATPASITSRDHSRVFMASSCIKGLTPRELRARYTSLKSRRDRVRLHASWRYTTIHIRSGTYKSTAGSQTMLWSVFQLHRSPCLCDWCMHGAFGIFPSNLEQAVNAAYMYPAWRDALAEFWDDDSIKAAQDQCIPNGTFFRGNLYATSINNMVIG